MFWADIIGCGRAYNDQTAIFGTFRGVGGVDKKSQAPNYQDIAKKLFIRLFYT